MTAQLPYIFFIIRKQYTILFLNIRIETSVCVLDAKTTKCVGIIKYCGGKVLLNISIRNFKKNVACKNNLKQPILVVKT